MKENNKGFIIKVVKYGIANRFPGRRIEINHRMLQERYKPLLQEILEHEMSHTDEGYTSHDLWLDFQGFKDKSLYHSFIFRNPSSWVQYSPFYRSEGRWYTDISLLIFWGIFLTGVSLYTWLLLKGLQ